MEHTFDIGVPSSRYLYCTHDLNVYFKICSAIFLACKTRIHIKKLTQEATFGEMPNGKQTGNMCPACSKTAGCSEYLETESRLERNV